MVTKPRDSRPGAGENPIEWLENELRETKGRLHKVESELSQALKQTYSLDADLRKLGETIAVTGSLEASLQAFREEVRQMRDQLGRVQDRQGAINSRMEQIVSQRQAETGRDRQDVGVVVKQIEAMNRATEQQDLRMKALEEVARHVEEEVAANRLTNQAIERVVEELNTRGARSHEATMRLDQEFTRMNGEVEKVGKSGEGLTDRMTLFLEQMRRVLERLDKIEQIAEFPDEVRDSMQKAAFEREQLVQRVAAVERLVNEIADRTDEIAQGFARLDQRSQQQGGELLAQAGQIQDLADQTKAGLKKVYQVLLRQRKRASEATNQEIKELTQGELHAGE